MKYRVPKTPHSPFTAAGAAIGYIFYLVSNILFMLFFPPFMLIFIWNLPLQHFIAIKVYRAYCTFLTRICLPTLGVYKVVEISGFENITPQTPVIFIANHRSRLDGPFVIPLLDNIGIIIKSSYARSPLFQNMVRYLDFISVDPHSIDSLAHAIKQSKQLLATGKRLLIFPEGTRASSARINTFKDLAFRLALETNTPIVPIIIHTNMPIMAKIKGSLFPAHRMSLVIRALTPQYGQENERPIHFADRVRKVMVENMQDLDAETVWEMLQPSDKNVTPKQRKTRSFTTVKQHHNTAAMHRGESP